MIRSSRTANKQCKFNNYGKVSFYVSWGTKWGYIHYETAPVQLHCPIKVGNPDALSVEQSIPPAAGSFVAQRESMSQIECSVMKFERSYDFLFPVGLRREGIQVYV